MIKDWVAWTMGVALGVALSVTGCSDKKGEGGASAPSVGLAPSSTEEKIPPDATVAPGAADSQGSSAMSNERDRERERKLPRG